MARVRWIAVVLGVLTAVAGIAPRVEAQPGRSDACPDCARAIQLVVDLHVVDLSGQGACGDAVACRSGLAGAEVRLFARSGPPPSAAELPALFDKGPSLAAAVTDGKGRCLLFAPEGVHVEMLLRWSDDNAKVIYLRESIPMGDLDTEKDVELIKIFLQDGSVRYASGHTTVVTG